MVFPDFATSELVWSSYDTFIFDADGVLWTGSDPVPKAAKLLGALVDSGKQVLVLTNNSTKSATHYAKKLEKLGFRGLSEKNIVGAGMVAACELARMKEEAIAKGDERARLPVYLLGSHGLEQMLLEAGVESFGAGPDTIDKYLMSNEQDAFIMDVDVSRKVFAVVSSFDSHISYMKIMKAVNYLKDPSVRFVATNEDLTFPGNVPGVAISGREPLVMGKPHKPTYDFIAERLGNTYDSSRTLMVGDRLDTDILFGNSNGMDTLLVLTGVSRFEDLDRLESELDAPLLEGGKKPRTIPSMMPKLWANSVADLVPEKH